MTSEPVAEVFDRQAGTHRQYGKVDSSAASASFLVLEYASETDVDDRDEAGSGIT